MAFPVNSPRTVDYTGNFIPEIWSGKLIENFYDATVLSAISNTDCMSISSTIGTERTMMARQRSPLV